MKSQLAAVESQPDYAQVIQEQLVGLEVQIQERAVLGENTDMEQPQAFDLLHDYGLLRNWTTETYEQRRKELAERLNDPEPQVYHTWINTFANRSINGRLTDNTDRAEVNADKARTALSNLAYKRDWNLDTYENELKRLETFIANGESNASKLSRSKKLQAGLGLLVTGAFARLASVGQATPETTPAVSDEKQAKRERRATILKVGAGVGALALGTAGLLIGFDVFGGAAKAHQHMANMPHPTKTPHGSGASSALPTPTKAPSSQPLKPSVPSRPIITKPHRGGLINGPGQRTPKIGHVIQPHIERLNYHLDNIWEHARRALGKKATTAQITNYDHKILRVNHFSERQARMMQVGKSFLMPRA